jgi:hypothetical protein
MWCSPRECDLRRALSIIPKKKKNSDPSSVVSFAQKLPEKYKLLRRKLFRIPQWTSSSDSDSDADAGAYEGASTQSVQGPDPPTLFNPGTNAHAHTNKTNRSAAAQSRSRSLSVSLEQEAAGMRRTESKPRRVLQREVSMSKVFKNRRNDGPPNAPPPAKVEADSGTAAERPDRPGGRHATKAKGKIQIRHPGAQTTVKYVFFLGWSGSKNWGTVLPVVASSDRRSLPARFQFSFLRRTSHAVWMVWVVDCGGPSGLSRDTFLLERPQRSRRDQKRTVRNPRPHRRRNRPLVLWVIGSVF